VFRRHSAASNSVNPGSFSKWRLANDVKYRRRTRIQISASEAFAKKFVTLFRDGFRDYFRHAYKLHTSLRQPSTRTGEFTMAAADSTRAEIICLGMHKLSFYRGYGHPTAQTFIQSTTMCGACCREVHRIGINSVDFIETLSITSTAESLSELFDNT